ncbi:MAG: VOC family protein [Acidimicrobiales bacterium]
MTNSIWSQTMLVVSDVERSSTFYCDVLGLESGHGGDEYEQLIHNGEIVMQLHHDGPEDAHAALADPTVPKGNGLLVWFEVADFDGAVSRARTAGVAVERDVHTNPNAKQREFWLRDPDGYLVVLSGESSYRPR